jgi:hypothetical protein
MFAGQAKKLLTWVTIIALATSATWVFGQSRTNVAALKKFAKESADKAKKDKKEATRLARILGYPLKRILPDGSFAELMRFEGSTPVYYITANLGANQTVGAAKVWPGGITGLNLTGEGVTLGEWDAGKTLLTHQEIIGRAVNPDSAAMHYHSVHVSGTLIAAGVDPNAKGGSFMGLLRSYDWGSDDAEMAVEAAAGLVLSNHSYRSYAYEYGSWCISRDTISYNAPYYLIGQAAGNEGSSYRTLGNPACAKNSLTVGAVTKHPAGYGGPGTVTIADFSSRGPTPDGRIKPDIMAPGVDLYSMMDGGNTDYGTLSGTSMATPCAVGNMGLIVQYYRSTHSNQDMRSSTLRGLVIHTADEAGPADGPDYNFGWGQLNTNAACIVIKESLTNIGEIQQQTIDDDETFTYTVSCDGVQPIKVTLCWIDPAGPNIGATTTPALVNDLDLRVTNNGVTYEPWVLSNTDPTAAAIKGDNVLDNVEQVVFQPVAGQCVITVKTKTGANLQPSGSQEFSLIVTGAVSPHLTGFTLLPASLAAGETATGTVTLDLPAPSTGARVSLTNTNKNALTVPAAVTVPAGLTTGTFTVTAKQVIEPTTATVTASYSDATFSRTVSVNPSWITSLTLNPSTVNGGSTSVGTVSLGKAAGSGGAIVTLSSSNTAFATVDWMVVIPEGQTSATFNIGTVPVSNPVAVTITAAFPGPSAYALLTIAPAMGVAGVVVSPATARGGSTARGSVVLTMAAPNDLWVTLSSSDSSIVSVPSQVKVKKGSKTGAFSVKTYRTRVKKTATITASYGGTTNSTVVTVNP